MLNAIPVFGWFFSFFFMVSLSVPFWFIYTHIGLGTKYFAFLPAIYQAIPFWDTVGLFMVISILKSIMLPRFNVSNDIKTKK